MPPLPTRTIQAGLTYFALVFAAGFALGMIRVPFLVPRLGERTAELIELPFMAPVIVLAARFISQRFHLPARAWPRLGAGCLALAVLVAAEAVVALALEKRTLSEVIASRDPVSGVVFLVMLAVFALMPFVLACVPSGPEV